MRMQPDRLVVGDLRGPETFELVQAMLGTCDGTVASITGEGAIAALNRFSALAGLTAGGNTSSLREMIACALDVVVHVVRFGDGSLRIVSIDEVSGTTETGFSVQNLFVHEANGSFVAAGIVLLLAVWRAAKNLQGHAIAGAEVIAAALARWH